MWKTFCLSFFRNDLLKANLKRYFLFCKLHIWLVGFKYIATTYQISSFESAFSKDFNSSRVLFCPFMYYFYEKLHSVYGLSTLMYIRLIQFFLDFDLNLRSMATHLKLIWKTLCLCFFRNDLLKANLHTFVVWTLKWGIF